MSITRALVVRAACSRALASPGLRIATAAASPACSSCLLDVPSSEPDLIFTVLLFPLGIFDFRAAPFNARRSSPVGHELRTRGKLEGVVLAGGNFHAAASRLHITAYHVQLIADDPHRQPMAWHRHWRHLAPGIARRIVGFHRTESSHHMRILIFATGNINTSAI